MRLVFLCSQSEIEAGTVTIDLLPDANGNITALDGHRFREGNASDHTSAESSWTFCDVIAVEPDSIVLVTRSYPKNRRARMDRGMCSESRTLVVHPSSCEFFVHPSLLLDLPRRVGRVASFLEVAIDHGGTRHRAIRSTLDIPDVVQSSIYDLESGVRLTSHCLREGMQSPSSTSTDDSQGAATQVLTSHEYQGSRRLELPWRAQGPPPWMAGEALRYFGRRVVTRSPQKGLAGSSTLFGLHCRTKRVGKSFALFDLRVTGELDAHPDIVRTCMTEACGPGSIDAIWIAPDVLDDLREGQVIDRDPSTGVEVFVSSAGATIEGGWMVGITTRDAFSTTTRRYGNGMPYAPDGTMFYMEHKERSPLTGTTSSTTLGIAGWQGR